MQEYRFGNPLTIVRVDRSEDEETGKEYFVCFCRPLGHKRNGTFRKHYIISDASTQAQAARKAIEKYRKDYAEHETNPE